jgi:hypothetical protein
MSSFRSPVRLFTTREGPHGKLAVHLISRESNTVRYYEDWRDWWLSFGLLRFWLLVFGLGPPILTTVYINVVWDHGHWYDSWQQAGLAVSLLMLPMGTLAFVWYGLNQWAARSSLMLLPWRQPWTWGLLPHHPKFTVVPGPSA